ncbi:MAG: PTS sugar transporter subunit IIA [Clostridiaceae bacterium]|jgi:PTS system ascorbate-specific IIA component|nr:PTS sugar transporter subunit IIA [Clostridiaceae bacterium]
MLLKEIYEKKHFSFYDSAKDWRDAIRLSCKPLEADGTVEPEYAEEMIACVEKHGPYIVIMPGVAMPHSTENAEGANGTAIAFMKLEEPVAFEEGNPEKDAEIFFTLASTNPDEHMENMQRLFSILTNEEVIAKLKAVKSPEELLEINELLGE